MTFNSKRCADTSTSARLDSRAWSAPRSGRPGSLLTLAPHRSGRAGCRDPRPGGLYDGDDEASRVPGKPTRTHATRSDPGEVAASTASETRRDDLPSNARRRPSHSMHVGAQLRGLRAPCERFAPWVTPGPRITRFRLAADLGRMGLDTHRVSNKVSKITSRHLVPLDRAFPAHALVHGSRALGAPRSTSWPS